MSENEQKKRTQAERQNFSKLREVEAINGNIVLRVAGEDVQKKVKDKQAPLLRDVVLTIPDAIERCEALVVMASKMESIHERKQLLDVVKDTLAKIEEAKAQRIKMGKNPDGTDEVVSG